MADAASIAIKRAHAITELEALTQLIGMHLELEPLALTKRNPDQDWLNATQLSEIAAYLKQVAIKLGVLDETPLQAETTQEESIDFDSLSDDRLWNYITEHNIDLSKFDFSLETTDREHLLAAIKSHELMLASLPNFAEYEDQALWDYANAHDIRIEHSVDRDELIALLKTYTLTHMEQEPTQETEIKELTPRERLEYRLAHDSRQNVLHEAAGLGMPVSTKTTKGEAAIYILTAFDEKAAELEAPNEG